MKNFRVASVDIMRALTMLTMLFVNDFAGMTGLPHWLHHAAMDEDMLGFSDLVFPAFLFCVGMSIPYAIRTRYAKGDSHLAVLGHVAVRTLALLVMGVFSMNMAGVDGGLSHGVFALLAVAGYFLLWNVYPKRDGRAPVWSRILQYAGAALLIALVIYKDVNGMPFRVKWWGILGLIGWAYLACSLIYVFIKGDFRKVCIAWSAVVLLCILNSCKAIPAEFSSRALILGFYPGGWTHPALVMSGVFASSLAIRYGETGRSGRLIATLAVTGAVMFVLGCICHHSWIISKIQATPTWLFFCNAIYFPLFALLYWLADVKGHTGWARPVAPAGTATLTCYLLPSVWYAVQGLLGWRYPALLTDGLPGLAKALAFSFAIIFLTWVLGKCRVKIKI